MHYFYYDTTYWIVLIPVILLSVYAQVQVSGSFDRYSRVRNRRRITGAQAAYEVLRVHGITDVAIRPCRGKLTDHYDPRDNTIYLSEPVYNSDTVAAVGVAAHEAGHAVQYAVGYSPVRVRTAIIPVTQFGSQLSFLLLFIGLILYSQSLYNLFILPMILDIADTTTIRGMIDKKVSDYPTFTPNHAESMSVRQMSLNNYSKKRRNV